MYNFSTTRLSSALAIGAFGILAACSPKAENNPDTLATTPPATAATPTTDAAWTDANVVDVLTVANQGEVDYSQLGVEKAKDINDLNGKTVGKDFDVEFMEEQVDMHQETLDLLNDLDSRTTNADLKAAIAEAKPKVQAHLDQAKTLKDKVD